MKCKHRLGREGGCVPHVPPAACMHYVYVLYPSVCIYSWFHCSQGGQGAFAFLIPNIVCSEEEVPFAFPHADQCHAPSRPACGFITRAVSSIFCAFKTIWKGNSEGHCSYSCISVLALLPAAAGPAMYVLVQLPPLGFPGITKLFGQVNKGACGV